MIEAIFSKKSVRFIDCDTGDTIDPLKVFIALTSKNYVISVETRSDPIFTELKCFGARADGISTVVSHNIFTRFFITKRE